MKSLLNRTFIIFVLLLAILVALPGCEEPKPDPKASPLKPLPVLGKDPLPDLLAVEEQSRALARWAEQGIKNAVLINIAPHDNIRKIPDSKIKNLKEMYHSKNWKGLTEADSASDHGLYNSGNWIYAGARLGMFQEVYWVIPSPYFSQGNPEVLLRQFLKSNMFSDEDIKTFSVEENRFRGSFEGIPFTVCDIESLPEIKGPLLLSIDTYFFPVFSNQYRINYLSALNTSFSALFNNDYRIQGAVISYSVNGEYLQPHLRWVGDELATVLRTPAVLNEPPSALLPLLQNVDNAYRSSNPVEIIRLIEGYPALSTTPSLLLYKAYAHMLQGESEKAYKIATEGCTINRMYCTGLSYIATLSFTKDQCAEAEKFFRAAYNANPEIRNGLYYFAHCLRDLGKIDEAIFYYKKDALLNGSFPADFLLFETYLINDDRDRALAALNDAIDGLGRDPYAEVINTKAASAIYRAIDFSEKNGLKGMTANLKGHPAIQKMFTDYPGK